MSDSDGKKPKPIPGETLFCQPDRWRALQAERLHDHLTYCQKNSSLYQAINTAHFTAQNLTAILRSLPLTTKDQLAAAGPAAFAIPPEDAREWVCTSGTAGRPLDVPLSASDLDRLAQNEAAALSLAGVQRGDVLLLAVAMDRLFIAGLAYWLGGQQLGATCIRMGPQLAMAGGLEDLCQRLGKSRRIFVVAVPSFLLSLKSPVSPIAPNLTAIIAIGEPLRNADLSPNILAQRLTERFACPILSTYASTETCTTFAEGPTCIGNHLNPNLAILEVLDDAANPVPDAHIGELVITPLGVQGIPLLRFRTGDMAAAFSAPCPCGRTTPRIGPIVGRRQQLLKIRGASIYPNAIFEALRAIPEVLDSAVIADHDDLGHDRAVVLVNADCDAAAIADKLQSALRVRLEVRLVPAEELAALQRSPARKPRRFLDRRNNAATSTD